MGGRARIAPRPVAAPRGQPFHRQGWLAVQGIETISECPLCGGRSFRRLPTPGHWIGRKTFEPVAGSLGICKCRSCSLVFSNPRPAGELLGWFYGGDDYGCHSATYARDVKSVAANLHHIINDHLAFRPGMRLLDYGCGGGGILFQLQALGWDSTGYDIGQAALASSRELGLKVTSDLGSLAKGSFDAITMAHVIEHLDNPLGALAEVAPLLAPGGRLFISTPNTASLRAMLSLPIFSRRFNFDERYRAFPIHLFFYTPRTLPAMVAKAGLTVQGLANYGLGLENLLLRQHPKPAQGSPRQEAAAAAAAPAARESASDAKAALKRLFFRLRLGDNLLAIASR